jgi:hypothetical protein
MLVYVIFGGMLATTWVQIVKAVLLMAGTILLSVLVLAQFHFSLFEFFDAIARVTGSFASASSTRGVALTRFKQNHRTQTLDAVALVHAMSPAAPDPWWSYIVIGVRRTTLDRQVPSCDVQNQALAACSDVLAQRCNRGRVLSGCERSLQACDRRSLSSHPVGHLGLSEPSILTRLEERVEQSEFFALQALHFNAHSRAAHHLLHDFVMTLHA